MPEAVWRVVSGNYESLTQVIHEARADDGGGQEEKCDLNIESALESNTKFSETRKPCMHALDDPSMSPEPLTAFHVAAGDTGLDATLLQITPAAGEVLALVCMQLARTFAGLVAQARHRRDGIKRGLECHRIVSVGARDRNSQRDAACVYDDVPFQTKLSPVRRVGAGFLAPGDWRHWRHRGLRTSNQSGRVHVIDEASPDAIAPKRPRLASLVNVASMSRHCRNQASAASFPMGYRFAGHTRCRSRLRGHRPFDVDRLWATV